MMDRLLRIIGCDPVEVNRKGRPILPGVRMHVRFILVSNELPNFRDASNAITARYLVLRTTKTVPPERRDTDLMEKLGAELPGSLNLAIEGRRRLRERGRFLQPESAADLIETAEDLASPVKECVRECFVLREGAIICKATAFRIWREWAEAHGERVGDAATLGKSLFAAFSGLRATRPESTATRSTPMRESKPGVPDDGRLSTGAADARRA
jgi:putative DNA primase/helicase